jgi:hypothetical protein
VRWFRRNAGWTVRLALLALAVQLAVSFGHVHVPDVHAGISAGIAAAAPAKGDDDPQHPGPDYCAICAVMHLAGSLTLPESAVLATPAFERIAWSAAIASPIRATHRDHFRARGPPQA